MKCKRCNRPLKSQKSIELGYGPICAKLEGIITKKREWKRKVKSRNILDFCLLKEDKNERRFIKS